MVERGPYFFRCIQKYSMCEKYLSVFYHPHKMDFVFNRGLICVMFSIAVSRRWPDSNYV